MEIKVTSRATPGVSLVLNADVPETLQGMVDKYGEDAVYHMAESSATIALQNIGRKFIGEENAHEKAQAAVNDWQPGTRTRGPRKSALERATESLSGLSAEQLRELLAKVKAAQHAAQNA